MVLLLVTASFTTPSPWRTKMQTLRDTGCAIAAARPTARSRRACASCTQPSSSCSSATSRDASSGGSESWWRSTISTRGWRNTASMSTPGSGSPSARRKGDDGAGQCWCSTVTHRGYRSFLWTRLIPSRGRTSRAPSVKWRPSWPCQHATSGWRALSTSRAGAAAATRPSCCSVTTSSTHRASGSSRKRCSRRETSIVWIVWCRCFRGAASAICTRSAAPSSAPPARHPSDLRRRPRPLHRWPVQRVGLLHRSRSRMSMTVSMR
mmetsp:Transcript_53913/g.135491  ORF Transcript_53913/g.135491 Transcript_53913/m.135491 type:complete len:264 (+) Transcript_53913:635-1426(+)